MLMGQKVVDYHLKNKDEQIIWSLAAHMHCKKCLRMKNYHQRRYFPLYTL
jgi:hypothetical protein